MRTQLQAQKVSTAFNAIGTTEGVPAAQQKLTFLTKDMLTLPPALWVVKTPPTPIQGIKLSPASKKYSANSTRQKQGRPVVNETAVSVHTNNINIVKRYIKAADAFLEPADTQRLKTDLLAAIANKTIQPPMPSFLK